MNLQDILKGPDLCKLKIGRFLVIGTLSQKEPIIYTMFVVDQRNNDSIVFMGKTKMREVSKMESLLKRIETDRLEKRYLNFKAYSMAWYSKRTGNIHVPETHNKMSKNDQEKSVV